MVVCGIRNCHQNMMEDLKVDKHVRLGCCLDLKALCTQIAEYPKFTEVSGIEWKLPLLMWNQELWPEHGKLGQHLRLCYTFWMQTLCVNKSWNTHNSQRFLPLSSKCKNAKLNENCCCFCFCSFSDCSFSKGFGKQER